MAVATASVSGITAYHDGFAYNMIATVTVDASPSTYATGGITLNLFGPRIYANHAPLFVSFTSVAGYNLIYIPGTSASNGLVKVFAAGSGTELSAAAVPAGLSGDTIKMYAVWKGMI